MAKSTSLPVKKHSPGQQGTLFAFCSIYPCYAPTPPVGQGSGIDTKTPFFGVCKVGQGSAPYDPTTVT